ncbi:hypothetical protein [Massilibacteroides sp.]|uniref:hypothetical protein n=1 Tax=Massilibacteroides sp. TaxID=2034766 RepID=UPI002612E105|nr:hypothetical protein [Massilibacteroides sp.]MDD4515526.1 hypothetical protein [Massilibacteroides sp.]
MKRICFVLFFLLWGGLFLYAQSDFTFMLNKEGKIIALPKYVEFNFNIPEFSYKSYTPASTRMITEQLKTYEPGTTTKLDERPMDMQVMSGAYKPYYDEFALMKKRVSPTVFDFEEVEFFPLNENLMFSVAGQQQTWMGLGGQTSINPDLTWHSGPWEIGGGGYVARYFTPFNMSPGLVSGANTHASFQATDWLKVRAWGQYAGYANKEWSNPHMAMNPLFYHNNIGGALEFRLNKDLSIGAGMQYEFNPMKNKWERQFLLFPIFH